MATLALARWSSSLTPTSLPSSVRNAAMLSFYNYIGCTIGGSNHTAPRIAQTSTSIFAGQPTSTILGRTRGPHETDAPTAAFINGIASHVHDYDDTHLATIIHPTGPVASALLALCEFRYTAHKVVTNGETFLTALTAGIEAECKLGLAVWPAHYDVGWHITSTTGSIGAAVACARLLNLNTEETAHAIGIASTQVTGLREFFGSHTKSFHVGRAAQNGLLAAVMAEGGFTSTLSALEAKRGWANVVSTQQALDERVAELGKVWETEKNAFKPFPCGIVIHPVIDGCTKLHEQVKSKGGASSVKSVHLKVHPLVLELTGKKTPRDGLEAKFSVYHGAAIGLLFGRATPALYEDDIVRSGEVVRLRDSVDAVIDENLEADAANIEVVFTDGEKLVQDVDHALGSLHVPMSREQLEFKFIDQCEKVVGTERAKNASQMLFTVETVENFTELVKRL